MRICCPHIAPVHPGWRYVPYPGPPNLLQQIRTSLTDIVREADVLRFLLSQALMGLESIEYTDRYLEPISDGYRDLQLAVRFQNFVCELQLSVGLLVAVKASGHRSFVVAREVAAAVEMGDVGSCR